MRTAAGLAWRGAVILAFGATAALAVTLSRPPPVPAAQTTATHASNVPRCTAQRLAISLGSGTGISGSSATARYLVHFTNISPSPCTLTGYPDVAAYDARGEAYHQVGNAASQEESLSTRGVVLGPGATAHAEVDLDVAGVPVAMCRPVTAAGLRVAVPGQSTSRYLRSGVRSCSAAGPQAPVYLRVSAIEPGAGALASPGRPGHGKFGGPRSPR
jgi:hypothetical protein